MRPRVVERSTSSTSSTGVARWRYGKQFAVICSGDFLPHCNRNPRYPLPSNGWAYTDEDPEYPVWRNLVWLRHRHPKLCVQLMHLTHDYTTPSMPAFCLEREFTDVRRAPQAYREFLQRAKATGWFEVGWHGHHHMPDAHSHRFAHEFDAARNPNAVDPHWVRERLTASRRSLDSLGITGPVGFRPPGRAWTPALLAALPEFGVSHLFVNEADLSAAKDLLAGTSVVVFADNVFVPVLTVSEWARRMAARLLTGKRVLSAKASINATAERGDVAVLFFHADLFLRTSDSVGRTCVARRLSRLLRWMEATFGERCWWALPSEVAAYVRVRDSARVTTAASDHWNELRVSLQETSPVTIQSSQAVEDVRLVRGASTVQLLDPHLIDIVPTEHVVELAVRPRRGILAK